VHAGVPAALVEADAFDLASFLAAEPDPQLDALAVAVVDDSRDLVGIVEAGAAGGRVGGQCWGAEGQACRR
jgi:hypothetical protein